MPPTTTLADAHLSTRSSETSARAAAPTVAIGAVVLVALALLLYRPWEPLPFETMDFSEFLPLLTGHDTLAGRFAAFVRYYYVDQGRANLLGYGALTLKWTLFGDSSAAWQLSRFALMLGIMAGSYALLRRLGTTAASAALATALFLVANTAGSAWTRLTMGEPLGLALVLGAAHLAAGYRRTTRWRRDAVLIALACALALLAKEMLVACVPFVLLIAASRRADGLLDVPRVSSRILWLAGTMAALCGAALVPVALAAMGAPSESFTAPYGGSSITIGWYVELVRRMMLLRPILFPGNLALAALLVAGLIAALARRDDPQPLCRALLAMSLPLMGAAAYVPWPKFEQFYGLPFLLGPALLLATAITEIERRWRRGRWLAYAACVLALGYHGLNAAQEARETAARRIVNAQIVDALVSRTHGDTIFVALPFRVQQAWQGVGPTLRRYAMATHPGAQLPAVVDVLCDEGGRRYKQGLRGATLVTYSNRCGMLPRASVTFVERFRYVDWGTLKIADDSLRADIIFGGSR